MKKLLLVIVGLVLILGCAKKSENLSSLPYCSPKLTESQALDIAKQYLMANYPDQTVNEAKLAGCNEGKSTYTSSAYKNNDKIADLIIDGNDGNVVYARK